MLLEPAQSKKNTALVIAAVTCNGEAAVAAQCDAYVLVPMGVTAACDAAGAQSKESMMAAKAAVAAQYDVPVPMRVIAACDAAGAQSKKNIALVIAAVTCDGVAAEAAVAAHCGVPVSTDAALICARRVW